MPIFKVHIVRLWSCIPLKQTQSYHPSKALLIGCLQPHPSAWKLFKRIHIYEKHSIKILSANTSSSTQFSPHLYLSCQETAFSTFRPIELCQKLNHCPSVIYVKDISFFFLFFLRSKSLSLERLSTSFMPQLRNQ